MDQSSRVREGNIEGSLILTAEGIEAELLRFQPASLKQATRARYAQDLRGFLVFLAQDGSGVSVGALVRYEAALRDGGRTRSAVQHALGAARAYVRHKAGELGADARYLAQHRFAKLGRVTGSLPLEERARIEAELARFKRVMEEAHGENRAQSYGRGARALLEYLASVGVVASETGDEHLTQFLAQLEEQGPAGRGELTREKIFLLGTGARAYLREKLRSGDLPRGRFLGLLGEDGLDRSARATLSLFEADLSARGYATKDTHYRCAARDLLLFLSREGRALGDVSASDLERFSKEVGRTRSAQHVLGGVKSFLGFCAERGLVRAGLGLPAGEERPRVCPAGSTYQTLLGELEEGLRGRGLAEHTRYAYLWAWRDFLVWAESRGLGDVVSLTRQEVCGYLSDLQTRKGAREQPLASSTQVGILGGLRAGFAHLVRAGMLLCDPTTGLRGPRKAQRLPATVKPKQLERILDSFSETPRGYRDRALLEVLYGTGIRRAELRGLCLGDVDLEAGTLLIRQGKGSKDRIVPLGRKAQDALLMYLVEGRKQLLRGREPEAVFVSNLGRALSVSQIYNILGDLGRKRGLRLTPHVLRHTCATELLRGRADIRHIQRLLGHKSLATTERYTRVDVSDLKKVIRRCHPREKEKK